MATFLAQNKFINSADTAECEAVANASPPSAATANLSDGAGAKPLTAIAPSEAATVSGRAPVAATLSHNKITQAVEIQSSCGVEFAPHDGVAAAPTPNVRSGTPPGPQDSNPALSVSSEPSLPAVAPTAHVAAGLSDDDLTQLLGMKRRPLALPRFAPDFPGIWKAMHDKSAPRAVLDPLWADASPMFLQDVR